MTAPFTFGALGVPTLWAVLACFMSTLRRCLAAANLARAGECESAGAASNVLTCSFPLDCFLIPFQRPRIAASSP